MTFQNQKVQATGENYIRMVSVPGLCLKMNQALSKLQRLHQPEAIWTGLVSV